MMQSYFYAKNYKGKVILMKELLEKRAALLAEMEGLISKAKTEKRAFEDVENTRVEEIKTEVRNIDATIKAEEEIRSFESGSHKEKKEEKRELGKELISGKVLELDKIETRAITGGISTSGNVAIGSDVVGETWANSIIRQVEYVSPLYAMVNKIKTSSPHNIVLQGNKIGKFVKTAELGKYAAQNAEFKTKTLGAIKYTNMFSLSKEIIEDSMYNIEGELMQQTKEALAETLDELLVKGDSADKVEGLEALTNEIVAGGVKKVSENDLIEMFYSLKSRYRANSAWFMSDATCKQLAKLKDTEGRPLLTMSYNVAPVGSTSTVGAQSYLLGRPVVVNDNISDIAGTTAEKCIYFGDVSKALTVGIRTDFKMEKDTSVGFYDDTVAIKSSIRLDSKVIDEEAMVCLKSKIA